MFCYKCGKEIRDDSVFCQYCGATIKSDETETQTATAISSEKKKKPISLWIGLGVLLAGIICAAIIIPKQNKKNEENYQSAVSLINEKEYDEATSVLATLKGYKDSAELLKQLQSNELNYQNSLARIEIEDYDSAIELLTPLGNYKDSEELLTESRYQAAVIAFDSKQFEKAKEQLSILDGYKDSADYLSTIENYLAIMNAEVGDIITFGAYEQNNIINDGKENIEWIVLDKKESSIFVISRYALDCMHYNNRDEDVRWSTCYLREWLNGAFLQEAFTEKEQNSILEVTVHRDSNDTQNQIFLLSMYQAENYFPSDAERVCIPTDYAIARGAEVHNNSSVEGNLSCWWWVRMPGCGGHYMADVYFDGSIKPWGQSAYYAEGGVRPAMWINLQDSDISIDVCN